VAEKLGMHEPIVLARVSNYRKQGLNLQKMRGKNTRRVDVEVIKKRIGEQYTLPDRRRLKRQGTMLVPFQRKK
jgi:hypothetical protein